MTHRLVAAIVLLGLGGGATAQEADAGTAPARAVRSDVEISGTIDPAVSGTAPVSGLDAGAGKGTDAVRSSGGAAAPVISVRTRVRRLDSAARPRQGYAWLPSLAQFQAEYINEGGWNQSRSGNDGRTGVAAFRTFVEQNGNGDAGAYYANCQIGGTGRAEATHWLAQPACVILNGDVGTTVPHSYLNVQEFSLADNGRDVAGIGAVYRFERTVNTAAQGEVWMGLRYQSTGTRALDVGISNSGMVNIGMDTVLARADADFDGGAMVALNMAAGQKVVYNSQSGEMNGIRWFGERLGSAFDAYSEAAGELARCNGASCLGVGTGVVRLAGAGLRLAVVTAAGLPACDGEAEGTLYAVNDAASEGFNADLVGGGRYHVMAYCNGTRWKVR